MPFSAQEKSIINRAKQGELHDQSTIRDRITYLNGKVKLNCQNGHFLLYWARMREDVVNFIDEPQVPTHHRKRTVFLILLIGVLAFITVACVSGKGEDDLPEDPLAYDQVTLEPKSPESFFKKLTQVVIPSGGNLVEEDDSINILLLGMGGVGQDGPYLTDTIMIARIKPSTNQIALISIPRDLA